MKLFCSYILMLLVPKKSLLIILQGFFRKLERLSGYKTVNLSNIGHLRDAIFIEVQIEYGAS